MRKRSTGALVRGTRCTLSLCPTTLRPVRRDTNAMHYPNPYGDWDQNKAKLRRDLPVWLWAIIIVGLAVLLTDSSSSEEAHPRETQLADARAR